MAWGWWKHNSWGNVKPTENSKACFYNNGIRCACTASMYHNKECMGRDYCDCYDYDPTKRGISK